MMHQLWARLLTFLPPTPRGRATFVALLTTGVLLRTAGLTWGIPDSGNQSSVYHDEGHVLTFALKSHEDFKKDFGEYEIVRPVYLFHLLGRPLIAAGEYLGINDPNNRIYELAALRSISAAFGIAGIVAIYALGKSIASPTTGLWAGAFLVFMPAHWYYSQILKGDVMVATLFTLLLVYAIRIARTADWPAYVGGALVLGAGTALKATTIIAAPVLVLAHFLFAVRQKRVSAALSGKSILSVAIAAASFAALYPYPFTNYDQYTYLLENPSMQHLTPRFLVRPAEYLDTLKQYHSPTRPFFEMIFGKFLLAAFIPSLAAVLGGAVWHVIQHRRVELVLVIALLGLFLHSLTFSAALDERYVLPLAPFAALFPALTITWLGTIRRAPFPHVGNALGAFLVAGTAAITAVTFPTFAFADPRQQVVDWIRANAPAGSVIAQASQTSRWALVFDPTVYTNNSFAYGPEGDRHIAQLVNPDYVIVQQEPWNYDHTFRYELAGIDIKAELEPFLAQYEEQHTFGHVPTLLGMRIPQTLGTPVIHVYSTPRRSFEPQEAFQTLLDRSPALVGELPPVGSSLHFTVEVPGSVADNPDTYVGVTIEDVFTPPQLSRRFEEPTVLDSTSPTLLVRPRHLAARTSFLIHTPREGEVEFYLEREGSVSFYGSGVVRGASRIYAFNI